MAKRWAPPRAIRTSGSRRRARSGDANGAAQTDRIHLLSRTMPKTILGGGRRGATLMLAAVLSAGSTLIGCDTGLLLHQGVPQDGANDGADGTFGGDGTFGDSTREGGNSPMDATGEHATMCNADQDCMGNPMGSHCDLNTQMCEPCLQNPNTCPQGQYCNAQFQCVGGCESDLDCTTFDAGATDGGSSGGRCNVPVHQCVQCLGDLDCPSMLVCMQNTCVQGCSSSRPARPGPTAATVRASICSAPRPTAEAVCTRVTWGTRAAGAFATTCNPTRDTVADAAASVRFLTRPRRARPGRAAWARARRDSATVTAIRPTGARRRSTTIRITAARAPPSARAGRTSRRVAWRASALHSAHLAICTAR